jgi:hypothetical protein
MGTEQLLTDISEQMGYAVAEDRPLDKKDWTDQFGVLLTVNEADIFRQFLVMVTKLNK